MENKPLLDLIIGIDEKGSTSLVNAQLVNLAKALTDLKVKISVDGVSSKDILKDIEKITKQVQDKGQIKLSGEDLFSGQKAKIDEIKEKYSGLGATITKVFNNGKTGATNYSVSVKDLYGNLKKITLDNELKEVGSTFAPGFETNLKNIQIELGKTGTSLLKVKKEIASGKSTPFVAQQEIDLTNQLDAQYGRLTSTIQQYNGITENRKNELLAAAAAQKTQRDALLATSEAYGANQLKIDKAKQALIDYKKESANLTKIQLTSGKDSDEAKTSEAKLRAYKGLAKGMVEVRTEMDNIAKAQKKAFATQLLEKQNKQLDGTVEKLRKLGTALNNKQAGLLDAELTGNTKKVSILTKEVEQLKTEFNVTTAEGIELGNALNKIDDVASIERTSKEFLDLNQQLINTADNAGKLDRAFGSFLQAASNGADVDELAKSFKNGAIAEKELGEAIFGTDAILKRQTSDKSKYQQMTKGIQVSVKDAAGVYRLWNIVLDENTNKLRISGGQVDSMSHKVVGFSNQIKDAAKKIATWGISTKIVYGTWRAFLAGVQVVRDLDKELTQIAVVSGKTRESVKYLGNEYAEMAVKMAQSVLEVAKLNTELVRQGLSIEEAAERADTIMKLSSAGNISMEQSLQVITTGVNALGEAHTKVADVILKAANVSASDVEGLGEAFTKTASGAKAAGLSIEETTSLLATMKDITQEGDSQLGTSLKAILARFNKINEETGEMNEDLNTVQTAIESVGVAFLDEEGQIRNVYDILEELSGTWDTLDKNTKSYIATQAAGVRQQNRFFAVMDNFNQVQAINNDLTTAAGTLQASYGTYLESTEAASVRLKATLDKLWISFINSELLTFLSNTAAGLVKVIDFIGMLPLAITAVGLRVLMTSAAFKGMFTGIMTDGAAAVGLIAQLKGMFASFPAMFAGLRAGAITLGSTIIQALPGMIVVTAISLAIGKLIELFYAHNEAMRVAKQLTIDYYNETVKLVGSQHSIAATLQTAGEEYLILQKKVNQLGGTYGLTAAELDRYYTVQAQIKEALPTVTSHLDENGRVILDNVSATGQLTEGLKEYLDLRVQEAAIGYQERIRESDIVLLEERNRLEKEYYDIQHSTDTSAKGDFELADANYGESPAVKLEKDAAALKVVEERIYQQNLAIGTQRMVEVRTALLAEMGEISPELSKILAQKPVLIKMSQLSVSELVPYAQSLAKNLDAALAGVNFGGGIKSINDVFAEASRLAQEHASGFLSTEEYTTQLKVLIDGLKIVAQSGNEALAMLASGALESLEGTASSARDIVAATEEEIAAKREEGLAEASTAYQNATSKASGYQEMLDKLNDSTVTNAEIQHLIMNDYPQWASIMGNKIALSEAIQQSMRDEDQTRFESYASMLLNTQSFLTSSNSGYNQYISALGGYYGQDIKNYAELERSKAVVTEQLINGLNEAWGNYFELVGTAIVFSRDAMSRNLRTEAETGGISWDEYYKRMAGADADFATVTGKINTINASFDNLVNNMKITMPAIKDVTSGFKDLEKAGGGAADGVDSAADAIKELNEEMKAIQDVTKEVFDFALEYITWIEEQKKDAIEETYENEQNAIEETYDLKEKALDEEKDRQLELLQIREDAIKAEQEALDFLKKRADLQETIVGLEYNLAIASLDSSVSGATRRRTLEEKLAEERANLVELEKERETALQEEAFARERAYIEDQAEYERIQNELTRDTKLASNQTVHDDAMAKLATYYSDEQKYLMAVQATESGMIADLTGRMIPLTEAFKQLAIENGKFWTFFGQRDVDNFTTSVATAIEAIKRLGFETIQMWREVATAVNNATNAANSANSTGPTGGGTPRDNSTGAPPPPPSLTPQEVVNQAFQNWLKNSLSTIGYGSLGRSLAADGKLGPATKNAAATVMNSSRTGSATDSILNNFVKGAKMTTALLNKLKEYGISPISAQQAITGAASGSGATRTQTAFSKGGKVDYTGPAEVHGSKSKPEYVFNYPQFKDLAKQIAQYKLVPPPMDGIRTLPVPGITFGNLINIEGSVDKEVLPELKRISTDAITQLTNKLKGWGK